MRRGAPWIALVLLGCSEAATPAMDGAAGATVSATGGSSTSALPMTGGTSAALGGAGSAVAAAGQASSGGAPPSPERAGAPGAGGMVVSSGGQAPMSDVAGAGGTPPLAMLPGPDLSDLVPSGTCPTFSSGLVSFVVDGVARDVEVVMDEGAVAPGPLVFGWHATGGDPFQALAWFGDPETAELTALGGLLVAPYREPNDSVRPWYYNPGGPGEADNDMRLMDEVVACARDAGLIDTGRIHAYGMSAGGLMTTQVSLRRSHYVASVVVYSGGQLGPIPDQDPSNEFAAMVIYGGVTDISGVDGTVYKDASEAYVQTLTASGRPTFLCDHGQGHTEPHQLTESAPAQASAWRFLQDHPFGVTPAPYAGGFPAGFWQACSL